MRNLENKFMGRREYSINGSGKDVDQ